jgi:IS30 family transposase
MAKKTFPAVAIQKKMKRETEVSPGLINFVLLMYEQLTQAQRYTISTMRQNGSSLQAIADELNRLREEEAALKGEQAPVKKKAASTIGRELNRNRNKRGGYSPGLAHEMAMERRERIVRNTALKPGVLARAMKLLVEKRWSPEQISGYLKLRGIYISKERIYQEIRSNLEKYSKYTHHGVKYRRHQSKPYKTAGKSMIPDRVSIHDRPEEANGKRFGDSEIGKWTSL